MFRKFIPAFAVLAALTGCSAHQISDIGSNILIVDELPSGAQCTQLGEVVGSQGNWFTGDFTSNENLMIGARNELKNKAAALGGNYVLLQTAQDHAGYGSLGTTAYTVLGHAYKCDIN